ncbi:hypothetical protein [Sphingomonas sp.]|uniref:hypothetical protein n=1 Tax=Sphingomonas sp. TaxID=28214 RepID=UPI003CC57736
MAVEALIALLITQAAPAAATPDPLAASFAGWIIEVEDDLHHSSSRLQSVVTAGCVTTLKGAQGRWVVNWRTVDTVALEDVFVFLRGTAFQIAVVADVQDTAGRAKLRRMWMAMQMLARRCGGGALAVDDSGVVLP